MGSVKVLVPGSVVACGLCLWACLNLGVVFLGAGQTVGGKTPS